MRRLVTARGAKEAQRSAEAKAEGARGRERERAGGSIGVRTVSRLDHRDIIRAIADGQTARGGHTFFDEIEQLRLLVLACAACDDGARAVADHCEHLLAQQAAVLNCHLVEDESELPAAISARHDRRPLCSPAIVTAAAAAAAVQAASYAAASACAAR